MELNLEEFMEKHLEYKAAVNYDFREVMALIHKAKNYYIHEGTALIEVDIPICIVGDIHGQFHDLQRILQAAGGPDGARFLFLGDYVDRGPKSMEVICLLLAFKLAQPDSFYLLRGNHECAYINRTYGFFEELERRFSISQAMQLFKAFNDLFEYFPLAALVRKRILCMHGGLSPYLKSLNDIRKIPMPVCDLPRDCLALDLLWADPKYGIQGFTFNRVRECSYYFGEDVVHEMCKKLDLDLVVRAHQVRYNGYGFFAGQKLITVFSAPRYGQNNNRAGILQIDSEMTASLILLNPVTRDTRGVQMFQRTFNDPRLIYGCQQD